MKGKTTKISVGIVVFKGDNILFGKTKDNEGRTRYILPVGHLEHMESFTNCAKREIGEECGIEIENIKFQFISNTDNYKPAHFVHIGLIAKWKSDVPEVLEPGGIEEWEWRDRSDMPKDVSIGTALTLQALEEESSMYDMEG